MASFASVVTVSEKGQIAIPVQIRRSAKIAKGDAFVIIYKDGGILLERAEKFTQSAPQDMKALRHYGWESLRKMWNNPDDAAWSKELLDATRRRRAPARAVHRSRR